MSAKPSKKGAKKNPLPPQRAEAVPPTTPTSAPLLRPTPPASTANVAVSADGSTAWIDSSDPRKRAIGKGMLIVLWIYVAALWLLALDQTFHWGIFGPKVPAVP